jgi:hypothetical protein
MRIGAKLRDLWVISRFSAGYYAFLGYPANNVGHVFMSRNEEMLRRMRLLTVCCEVFHGNVAVWLGFRIFR